MARRWAASCLLWAVLHILAGRTDGGRDLPFTSRPESLRARLGQDITLPCHTTGTGDAVITWSWNGRLVSAGNMKVYTDDRIQVVDGGRELVVRGVTRSDRGEFVCIVNLKLETPTLRHTLEVLVAPVVSLNPGGRQAGEAGGREVVVEEGSRLELGCSATGFPEPTVSWVRRDQAPPVYSHGGQGAGAGGSLLLESVTPTDAGEYECRAENSEGTGRQELELIVFYAPRVTVSRRGEGGAGGGALLACSVTARPRAEVEWRRDGIAVGGRGSSRGQGGQGPHLLRLPALGEQDYGNYTCSATNRLGTASDSILMTGSPDPPIITSPAQGFHPTSYRLEWRVWSPPQFPIMNQSILYRMTKKGTSATSGEPGSWHNLALISEGGPASQDSGHSMVLTALQRDAEYELRLRAMNRRGWSQLSKPFMFKTAGDNFQVDSMSSLSGRQLTSSVTAVASVPALVLTIAVVAVAA